MSVFVKKYRKLAHSFYHCVYHKGYFVSTVGVDEELINNYVEYQETEERKEDGTTDLKLFWRIPFSGLW